MLVMNAGVPRSGTVLVNAILRGIFAENGISAVSYNAHDHDLAGLIRSVQRRCHDRFGTVLVHTHSWNHEAAALLGGSDWVTGFATYRDPRDVCVSLMRLHDHDFEAAAEMALATFHNFAAMIQGTDFMAIPYELLVREKQAHIYQIARRLGFWIGLDQVAKIDAATSVDHHRSVMEQVQAGKIDGLRRIQNRNRVLVEDPKTLINDRHIQSGKSGRWRDELNPDQQALANERFKGVIERFGYGT